MTQLSWEELLAVAELWRRENNRSFGILCSLRQFLFVIASITVLSADQLVISVQNIVKRLEIAPEPPFTEVVVNQSNLRAAWHSTTFEQPQGFVAETFDEVIQL